MVVAEDLGRTRASGAHGQVRTELESKLVCSGSGEVVGVVGISPENLVGDSGFELEIRAARWQRVAGVWGKERGERGVYVCVFTGEN